MAGFCLEYMDETDAARINCNDSVYGLIRLVDAGRDQIPHENDLRLEMYSQSQ